MRYRDYRWPCAYDLDADGPGGRCAITIRNISDRGAQVMGARGWGPGDRVTLRYRGGPIAAEVRWVAGDLAGLRFAAPVGAYDLSVIRRAAATAAGGGWSSWGAGLTELT
jgi:hypothetical protein